MEQTRDSNATGLARFVPHAVIGAVLLGAALILLVGLGNTGLWIALLVFFGARGALQAARYPAMVRATFTSATAPR